MTARVASVVVQKLLSSGKELALLDAREQGVHAKGHPFFSCSLPLSHLEMRVEDLVPRHSVKIVLVDDRDEGLAQRAAQKLTALGYSDVAVLEHGCAGWQASGAELFSGINVPSKAFGEFIEHRFDTPRIPPEELKARLDRGERLVILDSRPYAEYHRMNIPGSIDVPGAELAYRVHDLARDPDTLVVVNCAGRTRSIIGCQSLRNAGIPNRVVALKDGTMGWELAGYACEHGSTRVAPPPSPAGLERARALADGVAERFDVKFIDVATLRAWTSDPARTLFLLDVRTSEEFEQAHLAGSRHAPGGQLVQATDEFIGVCNARVVLVDPAWVRSVFTASWLNQMGWDEVYVLEPDEGDGFAGWPVEHGRRVRQPPGFKAWPTISPATLRAQLADAGTVVLDLSTSLQFRAQHVPGAAWAVRARLEQAHSKLAQPRMLVLTSADGVLAHFAAPEASALWPQAQIRVLDGGNAAWLAEGLDTESGIARATTTLDDVWYKPYEHEHEDEYEKHARAYLMWETALVDQIARDPTIRFRDFS
jgi:rhodanese-related sulfurtransferase